MPDDKLTELAEQLRSAQDWQQLNQFTDEILKHLEEKQETVQKLREERSAAYAVHLKHLATRDSQP